MKSSLLGDEALDGLVGDGDLARTALRFLAESDEATAAPVGQAIEIEPAEGERVVGLLLVGALVLMAFHADIEVVDSDQGGRSGWFWSTSTRTERSRRPPRTARRLLQPGHQCRGRRHLQGLDREVPDPRWATPAPSPGRSVRHRHHQGRPVVRLENVNGRQLVL